MHDRSVVFDLVNLVILRYRGGCSLRYICITSQAQSPGPETGGVSYESSHRYREDT